MGVMRETKNAISFLPVPSLIRFETADIFERRSKQTDDSSVISVLWWIGGG